MKEYREQRLTGERALFQEREAKIEYCIFADGESPLKESRDLEIKNTSFQWKYPLWYCENVSVQDCTMFEMARAGIWYTNHLSMKNTTYNAPKGFRRCDDITLERVTIPDASETLWNCSHVEVRDMTAKGDYFAMNIADAEFDELTLVGNYSFDGARNLTIRNSRLLSKDAFWNAENVTVEDSFITGEYLGWNSKNVTLINCTIESSQGMCYMEHMVMKNCRLLNTDLAFEYSTVDAEIDSDIVSVKNPISGTVIANKIGEIIFDNEDMESSNTNIVQRK